MILFDAVYNKNIGIFYLLPYLMQFTVEYERVTYSNTSPNDLLSVFKPDCVYIFIIYTIAYTLSRVLTWAQIHRKQANTNLGVGYDAALK